MTTAGVPTHNVGLGGANGFLTMAEPIAEMARRDFPGCKVILSTWCFDQFTSGEYDALEEKFAKKRPQWIDYILLDEYNGVQRYSGKSCPSVISGKCWKTYSTSLCIRA